MARLFSPVQALRRVQPEDFHVPTGGDPEAADNELWLEVDIEFEEAADEEPHPAIPPFFTHLALERPDGMPRVRIRLTATFDADGYIDEKIEYLTQVDFRWPADTAFGHVEHDRAAIEVHYLPACPRPR